MMLTGDDAVLTRQSITLWWSRIGWVVGHPIHVSFIDKWLVLLQANTASLLCFQIEFNRVLCRTTALTLVRNVERCTTEKSSQTRNRCAGPWFIIWKHSAQYCHFVSFPVASCLRRSLLNGEHISQKGLGQVVDCICSLSANGAADTLKYSLETPTNGSVLWIRRRPGNSLALHGNNGSAFNAAPHYKCAPIVRPVSAISTR